MMTRDLIVETAQVLPGLLPDGTPMGKFCIETANLGNLEWTMSPRQALMVAGRLEEYASFYVGPKVRKR